MTAFQMLEVLDVWRPGIAEVAAGASERGFYLDQVYF